MQQSKRKVAQIQGQKQVQQNIISWTTRVDSPTWGLPCSFSATFGKSHWLLPQGERLEEDAGGTAQRWLSFGGSFGGHQLNLEAALEGTIRVGHCQRALASNYESLLSLSKLASMPCTFNPCAFLEVSIASAPSQRLVLQLYNHKAPNTVQNFIALTTGEKGNTSDGIRLHYEGTTINRVVHGVLIQGGDLYGGKDANEEIDAIDISSLEFESEHDIFDKVGLLSLVGSGPSKNGYEFFITMDIAPELNGLNLVFGEVVQGMDVVYKINNVTVDESGKPMHPIVITNSGVL
ncbi:hypothetical protein GOP47_0000210 [Adiantum capillus-veneris]|uniref:Peptidyl-prolyl cis-trans isomerase n=1 Tax=Adiantum capillus-veneris TaxID=13818 RepID=A0A9D4ZS63_ADICA|nr:hypothetical protein GOP47_0000210 [Adiantum capillus-veneris]